MVVGCVPLWKERVLLCRRSIEPRSGKWTLPAGFLENGETVREGASRELMEEARATARELQPYGLYDIRHVHQVYLMFIAPLASDEFAAGDETLEARLFTETEIPWDDLAFPVVEMVLNRFYRDARQGEFPFHIDEVTRRMKRD
jgi:ADP-ribose pyrophosphatase YjhB (NUDIX family)